MRESHEIHKYTKREQNTESYNDKENGSPYLVTVVLVMVIHVYKTYGN